MSRASDFDFTGWSVSDLEELGNHIPKEVASRKDATARELLEELAKKAEREGLSLDCDSSAEFGPEGR